MKTLRLLLLNFIFIGSLSLFGFTLWYSVQEIIPKVDNTGTLVMFVLSFSLGRTFGLFLREVYDSIIGEIREDKIIN